MREEAQVSVIGSGLIGEKRLKALRETALGRAAWVYDPTTSRAEKLASDFGARVAPSTDAILEDPATDIVVIATPNQHLAELGEAFLRKGKHVLVEKPGAVDAEGIARMAAAANASGKLAKIGYNHRFHRAALTIHRLLASGEAGPVLWIRAAYGHGGRPGYEKEWRFQKAISGGGEIIDQGVHLLDLVRWWLGEEPMLIHGSRSNAFYRSTEEDNGFLLLRSKGGAHIQLHCSATQWKNLFRVEICTRETLVVWEGLERSYGEEKLTVYRRNRKGGVPEERTDVLPPLEGDTWAAEWRHFFRCVTGEERRLWSDVSESRWIFEVLTKIHQDEVQSIREDG